MKKSFLLLLILFLWMGVNSQTILYQDDFESYAVESYLAQSNTTWWTTWQNLPGTDQDAKIKNTFAHSTSKSFDVTTTTTNTDLILKLGDRTSGSFELNWWMYVEAPNAAYYNLQHYESPGTQWAYDVYFYVNGSGALLVGNDSVNFNYPKATWFQIRQVYNLDLDSARLYVNGTLIHQWPFHYTMNNTNGAIQLGGVDFFSESTLYTYYVDDLIFSQLSAPTNAGIKVTPDSIANWMTQGTNQTAPLIIQDTGATALHYQIGVIYDSLMHNLGLAGRTDTLHYDGPNYSAVGFNNVPVTASVAARFLNTMNVGYAGQKVTAVDFFLNAMNTTGSNTVTVKIWGMGPGFEPGIPLYQQNYTPTDTGWQHVVLDTALFVSGEELWIGYTFVQTTAGIFIPGTDAGPANPNGDFISTGVGWSHLSANPSLNYNWNIRAIMQGARIPHWLTATPDTGTIQPGGADTIQIAMHNDTLTPGRYTARLLITSNDPNKSTIFVPVVLDVYGVGVTNHANSAIQVYPNPADGKIEILSDKEVDKYFIIDLNGKIILTGNGKIIDVSNLNSGIYILKATTGSGTFAVRFVKK